MKGQTKQLFDGYVTIFNGNLAQRSATADEDDAAMNIVVDGPGKVHAGHVEGKTPKSASLKIFGALVLPDALSDYGGIPSAPTTCIDRIIKILDFVIPLLKNGKTLVEFLEANGISDDSCFLISDGSDRVVSHLMMKTLGRRLIAIIKQWICLSPNPSNFLIDSTKVSAPIQFFHHLWFHFRTGAAIEFDNLNGFGDYRHFENHWKARLNLAIARLETAKKHH
jgi:hypothetical protein